MALALVGLNANAAMYIVGNTPFGNWNPGRGVEMTDNGNGTYTYVTDQINGTVWFVFGDGLDSNWDTFNANYRYCPTNGGQVVEAGVDYQTQKFNSGDNAYNFYGTAGQPYEITFNTNNNTFRIDGYTEPVVFTAFTVAGTPASVFGTAWDPSNTANDMTLVGGLYTWTKQNVDIIAGTTVAFKVAANNSWDFSWPEENFWQTFDESGAYNLTITFNEDTKAVNMTATKVGDAEVNPLTGHLYVLGQVNGNNWNPSTGIEMATTDGNVFTLTDAVINNADGEEYGWFSFTSKLGENAEDWSITPYRRGAYEDQAAIQDGVVAPLNAWGTDVAFLTLPGVYDIMVNLTENTVLLTKKGNVDPYTGDLYILGEVNGNKWRPDRGVRMSYNAGEALFTSTVCAVAENYDADLDANYSYFSFTKMLAENEDDWESIQPYRYGAVADGSLLVTEELLGQTLSLSSGDIAFKVPSGFAYQLTVNIDNLSIVVEKTELIRGDVNMDHEINIADINAICNYIMSNDTFGINIFIADCNNDGEVNIGDINNLIHYIITGAWPDN